MYLINHRGVDRVQIYIFSHENEIMNWMLSK